MVLISRILGDCPQCRKPRGFGNIGVYGDYVLRGCMACPYKEKAPLPVIRKKVLYLDQFFFSNAFRASDPRFLEAATIISRLTVAQLLVVPYSSVHEDETHQWARHAELLDFIKSTSAGHEFEAAYEIPRVQILKAFAAWLNQGPSAYCIEQREAFRDDIHRWDNYVFVDVAGYYKDVETLRVLKQRSVEGLVDLFDGWRLKHSTFDQNVNAEYEQLARGYFGTYVDLMARVADGDDPSAFLSAPIMSMIVEAMLRAIPKDVAVDQRLRRCAEFLMQSEHFRQTPCAWLKSHIFATLKAQVKAGHYRKRDQATRRLRGFFFDVEHISTYAPYVDGFVMDNAMAELVSKPTVDLEARYGVKVFSLNNWSDLFDWLSAIESQGMSPEHRMALATAYPGTSFER